MADWATKLAEEIFDATGCDTSFESARPWLLKIIDAHSLMPVPRCETCAHWLKREMYTAGFCDFAADGDSKMFAELYDAVLTEPDFGCVQWKKKL